MSGTEFGVWMEGAVRGLFGVAEEGAGGDTVGRGGGVREWWRL